MTTALLFISDQIVLKLTDSILLALPAIIVSIGTLVATLRNGKKTDKVREMVNGRMDELLQRTKEVAHQEGRIAGVKDIVENGQVGVVVGVIPTAQAQQDQQEMPNVKITPRV